MDRMIKVVLASSLLLSLTCYGEDFFKDTFNRPGNSDINANLPMGQRGDLQGTKWTVHSPARWKKVTKLTANRLVISNEGTMGAVSTQHNFIDQKLLENGGFKVTLNIADFKTPASNQSDLGLYCGFGVGISEEELTQWTPFNQAFSFRGAAPEMGSADLWVGLADPVNPVLQICSGGTVLESIPVSDMTGTISAIFHVYGFGKGDIVTVSVHHNGRVLDINTTDASNSREFEWEDTDSNYVAIEARAMENAQIEEFGVIHIPKRIVTKQPTKRTMKNVVTSKKGIAGLFGISVVLLLLLRQGNSNDSDSE